MQMAKVEESSTCLEILMKERTQNRCPELPKSRAEFFCQVVFLFAFLQRQNQGRLQEMLCRSN